MTEMKCEKCGTVMVDRSTEGSICVECPVCGWGWATVTYDPTDDDRTRYEILLLPDNPQTTDVIRLIASIANINYLLARKLLACSSPVLLFKAEPEPVAKLNMVQQIGNIARRLTDMGIRFTISPAFPYEY